MKRLAAIFLCLFFATLVSLPISLQAHEADQSELRCNAESLFCPTSSQRQLSSMLTNFPTPNVTTPQTAIVTPPITVRKPITKIVTYVVETRGTITADIATFKMLVAQTLTDSKGWARLGVSFKEVASGGDFTMVLSEASKVPSFAAICDSQYSCQVGRYVVINQDRWQGATQSWNDAGGSLRDYRHMVVNHETGHWLGHGHRSCSGAGQAAAVMQQQSINLQGCKFNAWPLDSEITSSRLGIS